LKECLLDDFLEMMARWLSSDTVQKVYLNNAGQLVMHFTDGARSVYRITDCSAAHVRDVLEGFQEKGIDVTCG
jgi:hypothetical protein